VKLSWLLGVASTAPIYQLDCSQEDQSVTMSNKPNYRYPSADEAEIRGSSQDDSLRIEYLIKHYLSLVCKNVDQVKYLYQDPKGDLWLREYPHFERHGGGPPLLRRISIGDARVMFRDCPL
jgi:immunity protein 27 of polymorphic toxin system